MSGVEDMTVRTRTFLIVWVLLDLTTIALDLRYLTLRTTPSLIILLLAYAACKQILMNFISYVIPSGQFSSQLLPSSAGTPVPHF